MNRRSFVATGPALLGAGMLSANDTNPQAPRVIRPRATSGDPIEPELG